MPNPGSVTANLVLTDDTAPVPDDEIGGVVLRLEPGVPQKVAWRMAVVWAALGGGTQDVSQAYELGDCNAVLVTFAVLSATGSANTQLEGSSDKANWESVPSAAVNLTGLGFFRLSATGVNHRFVRLRYANILSPTRAIFSATIAGTRR